MSRKRGLGREKEVRGKGARPRNVYIFEAACGPLYMFGVRIAEGNLYMFCYIYRFELSATSFGRVQVDLDIICKCDCESFGASVTQ